MPSDPTDAQWLALISSPEVEPTTESREWNDDDVVVFEATGDVVEHVLRIKPDGTVER